ncbi:hypothetical protein AAEP86_05170 [Curtobacterium sp. L1-20]
MKWTVIVDDDLSCVPGHAVGRLRPSWRRGWSPADSRPGHVVNDAEALMKRR